MVDEITLNVLIIDDSSFFQRQLKTIINEHPQLKVIGFADNGKDAIEKVKRLKPDILTMDYEMPIMDGITALRIIMAENPLPILMLSSMTYKGARTTLDALDAGAADFMAKNFYEISNNSLSIKKRIHDSLLAIGGKVLKNKEKNTITDLTIKSFQEQSIPIKSNEESLPLKCQTTNSSSERFKVIVIGASTGGPVALTELLTSIPANFSTPILIVQHMPEKFTQAFAERLNKQCNINVKEAKNGDKLESGSAFLAPGGKQLIIDKNNIDTIKIIDSKKSVYYKPSVDITFASLSNTYKEKTLAIVLTGMGSDGCDGAHLLKKEGAGIWTQSKDSCLIYGMPMAIDQANLSDASIDINCIQQRLLNF